MDSTKSRAVSVEQAPESITGQSAELTVLVERARTGDAEAFGDLMLLYERRIISMGRQMGLSREDALDACQDTFVKVFRYIGGFRSGHSFFKWLHRIALNAIFDHRRRSRLPWVVPLEEVGEARCERMAGSAPSPASDLESADLAQKLLAGLDRLSRQERIVFVLRDLQGTSTREIGAILGLSQVTVRRHCMSARQKLRDRLFPSQD